MKINMSKKLLMLIATIASVLVVIGAHGASRTSCKRTILEEGNRNEQGYSYTLIHPECSGAGRVRVKASFFDKGELEKYQANNHKLEQRINDNTDREIPINITLSKASSPTEIDNLVRRTDLRVESYIIGVRDRAGIKHSLTYFPEAGEVPTFDDLY